MNHRHQHSPGCSKTMDPDMALVAEWTMDVNMASGQPPHFHSSVCLLVACQSILATGLFIRLTSIDFCGIADSLGVTCMYWKRTRTGSLKSFPCSRYSVPCASRMGLSPGAARCSPSCSAGQSSMRLSLRVLHCGPQEQTL